MSTATRSRIQLWIYGLAIFAITASLQHSDASVASTGAAAALLVLTALLASHTLGGASLPNFGREPIAATLRHHARRTSVLRQCDPDAAGHARPRAPGHTPSS